MMSYCCIASGRKTATMPFRHMSLLLLLLSSVSSSFQLPFYAQIRSGTALQPASVACYATTKDAESKSDFTEEQPQLQSQLAQSQPRTFLTLEQLASQMANFQFRNIVVVNGAGISVNAGIPDFRTPGTGLYSRLDELNLPYPEAVFELSYFRKNPKPFVEVAQSIWPGQDSGPKPTLAHAFVALLEQKGILKRVYTQNIDGLESLAGISDNKLIECHGHFRSASCISCKSKTSIDIKSCRDAYMQGQVYSCEKCSSPVKPDVVFFGDALPDIFMDNIHKDMDECDLLIVMGTSLLVDPVASIPKWVGPDTPRLLINRELVGAFLGGGGIQSKKRDVFAQGDCDDGVRRLCKLIGEDWATELEVLHEAASSTKRP